MHVHTQIVLPTRRFCFGPLLFRFTTSLKHVSCDSLLGCSGANVLLKLTLQAVFFHRPVQLYSECALPTATFSQVALSHLHNRNVLCTVCCSGTAVAQSHSTIGKPPYVRAQLRKRIVSPSNEHSLSARGSRPGLNQVLRRV